MDRYTALVDDGSVRDLAVFESEGWKRLSAQSLQLVQQWELKYWADTTKVQCGSVNCFRR